MKNKLCFGSAVLIRVRNRGFVMREETSLSAFLISVTTIGYAVFTHVEQEPARSAHKKIVLKVTPPICFCGNYNRYKVHNETIG